MASKVNSSYYVDWDDESGSYCVFDTEDIEPFAYASFSSKEEAKEYAREKNKELVDYI